MGDVLSQSEIDDLLNALTGGGAEADTLLVPTSTVKEAKSYNFARPNKFSKEQLRTLENIFDNYARIVSSFLTAYLRTSCHIEVASADQFTYNDFLSALMNPVVLGVVELSPLKGSVMLEISNNIGYSIIDRVLGGPGIGLNKMRDFSEIEKILLERIVIQILSYLPEPWENVIELHPRLEKIETNSQFAQIISPMEMVAVVTLSIKIGSSEGIMNFCLPHIVVEPIMSKLNTKYWFSQPEEENLKRHQEQISGQLEQAMLPLSAVIGRTSVTINDFIGMQVGDIIPLDSYINSDLDIMVGNLLKFQGKPGIHRGKNAIQITSLIRKED